MKSIVEDCMIQSSEEIWKSFETAVKLDEALKLKKIQERLQQEKEKHLLDIKMIDMYIEALRDIIYVVEAVNRKDQRSVSGWFARFRED